MIPPVSRLTSENVGQVADAAALRAMYQALVEQIPAVLYINQPDEDATTIFVSPQTRTILQLPEEAWFSGEWSERVHPDDIDEVSANYAEMLRSADVGVDEYRFIRPDGRQLWIHDRLTIIRDHAGDPVLVQGVMFDVTEQREAEGVLLHQAQLLERVEAISRRFSDLVLSGTGLKQVLDTLAGIVDNPVVFEDPAHQLIEFAQRSTPLGDLLDSWQEHSRSAHVESDPATNFPRLTEGTEPTCGWIPVRVRDEEWGRIHVLALESSIDELDQLALDRASAAVGLWLLASRDAAQLADSARSNLIADVWQGRWRSAREVLARSRSLGAALTDTQLVGLVVEAREVSAGTIPYDNAVTRRRALDHLLESTRGGLAEAGVTGLCAVVGDICIAILDLHGPEPARTLLERTAAGVVRRVADELPDLMVVVGASRPGTAEDLQRALTEASEAAGHGLRVEQRSGLHHVDDLGLRLLLGQLGDGPGLSRFVEEEIGPLLVAEAGGRTDLLQTLRVYLDHGCHKARAASVLHIERRTLYYRLDRIEAVLGRTLADKGNRLRIEVALQGLDVLQQRNAQAPMRG